jgi:hypothetical protein
MKKKSTLFALIAVACIAVALFFMYKETREAYDLGYEENGPEETESEENAPETAHPAEPVNTASDEQTN